MRATLVECPSYLNPVLLLEAPGARLYYGVPRSPEPGSGLVVHSVSPETVEAVRRLEPGCCRVYAAAGTVAARLASAMGHEVVEVLEEEREGPVRLVRGGCGLYAVAGGLVLAPPCEASALYSEAQRLPLEGAGALVVAAFGAGVDAYLHRLGVVTGASVYVVECASQWLGEAGTVAGVAVLRVGGTVEA